MPHITDGEWIKNARKQANMSQDELAKAVDISVRTLRSYEADESDPKLKVIRRISAVCDFEMRELFENTTKIPKIGELGSKMKLTSEHTITEAPWKKEDQDNRLIKLNFYDDIFASAGYGNHAYENQPAVLEFDKSFLENILNIKRFEKLDIIRVVGDSMLPSIKDGEYIIVERDSEARNGDTVIANIDGELYVKRLSKMPLSPYIILESENENYRPIELDTDEKLQMCNILGVVRSKIKLY